MFSKMADLQPVTASSRRLLLVEIQQLEYDWLLVARSSQ